MKTILDDFCTISSQKISSSKSKFSSPIMWNNPTAITWLTSSSFLSPKPLANIWVVPSSKTDPTRTLSDSSLKKIQKKLPGWKAKTLSLAGRSTLIQAVTSAIPAYVMQCYSLPKSITNHIDKLNRDFLWGFSPNHRKIHAINWSEVTKPKNLGGLGIR
ncbi:hypothetical protein ACSBR2_026606 [Camellia fascicularis]